MSELLVAAKDLRPGDWVVIPPAASGAAVEAIEQVLELEFKVRRFVPQGLTGVSEERSVRLKLRRYGSVSYWNTYSAEHQLRIAAAPHFNEQAHQ